MSILVVTLLALTPERGLPVFQPKDAIEEAAVGAALASIDVLGEARTVKAILTAAPQLMNLPPREVDRVRSALALRYREMNEDPRWRELETPLASAFAARPPSIIVVPPSIQREHAPVIVFLHGYGGSGKLFSFLLARAIPEAWIVAPSHGLSWARPKIDYLDRALARFEKESGLVDPRYFLVGLSDGGVGAFEVIARRPERFERMVSIVGVPRPNTIDRLPDLPILMINGKGDRFVKERAVRSLFARLHARSKQSELEWFEGGHYFLLDEDARALARVRSFLTHRTGARDPSP